MKCDRCYKNIPDTQMYPPVQIGFQFEPRQLCRKCIDDYKKVMVPFWNNEKPTLPKTYPSRERVGSIPHDIPYNMLQRISQSIPHEPIYINQRAKQHEGRKPTNIFSKLFYMLFFEKVDP